MTAPTATARVTPVGVKLGDGYQSKITFAADTDISFWEKTVTPIGFDGGDSVDTTTMHNSSVRTKAPRGLIDTTDAGITVAYDPRVLDQILALINVETTISEEFPDGSDWSWYGYLRSFTPGALAEGSQPEATIVIVSTNWDPTNNVEAVPNWQSSAGSA